MRLFEYCTVANPPNQQIHLKVKKNKIELPHLKVDDGNDESSRLHPHVQVVVGLDVPDEGGAVDAAIGIVGGGQSQTLKKRSIFLRARVGMTVTRPTSLEWIVAVSRSIPLSSPQSTF